MAEWSKRAREDFDEREEYRKENDEKDRYEKRGSDTELRGGEKSKEGAGGETPERSEREMARDAREDRREERGYFDDYRRMNREEREGLLIELRNAGADDDVDDKLDRLRKEYDYYEGELDKYDADYDRLMEELRRVRRDNQRYMLRGDRGRREEEEKVQDRFKKDIRDDQNVQSYDDLWEDRIG